MAHLDSLNLLELQSGLYSPEAQAVLGHRGVQVMPQRFLHEHLSHPLPHSGQPHQANQGFPLNLLCLESLSLHGGQQNLYWRTIMVNKRN